MNANDYFRQKLGYGGGLLDDAGDGVTPVSANADPVVAPNFDFAPTAPQNNRALWSSLAAMGAAMLANNRGGFGNALGHGLAAQQQGYRQGLDQATADNLQGFRSGMLRDDFQAKQTDRQRAQALRDALGKLQQNGDYWGNAAQVYASAGDPETAVKLQEFANGGKPTDAQRNYQFLLSRGVTPERAMQVFTPFAPPSMQYVPGSDYKPAGVFNPQSGQFTPTETPQASAAVDRLAPWSNLPQKQADQMRERVYSSESKKLDDLREQVAKGRATMQDLQRFGELNREQGTGGLQDRYLPDWLTTDAQKQEMLAIQARLAPQVRPAGSGATSDRDMALYLRSLPGIDKSGDVNRQIREQYGSNLDAAQKRLAAAEQYLTEHGHLNGFDAAYAGQGKPASPGAPKPVATPRQAFGSQVSRDLVQQAADKAGIPYDQMATTLKAKGVRIQ